jgi:hypothetical protein
MKVNCRFEGKRRRVNKRIYRATDPEQAAHTIAFNVCQLAVQPWSRELRERIRRGVYTNNG